jgi:hypothetical protein
MGYGYKDAPTYNSRFPTPEAPMEADRLNLIENNLHDLSDRASELRRYL